MTNHVRMALPNAVIRSLFKLPVAHRTPFPRCATVQKEVRVVSHFRARRGSLALSSPQLSVRRTLHSRVEPFRFGGHEEGGAGSLKQARCWLLGAGMVVSASICARNRSSCDAEACEIPVLWAATGRATSEEQQHQLGETREAVDQQRPGTLWVALRLVRHMVVFVPLALLYVPLRLCGVRAHDFWWQWAIFSIENSGPALVKLGQWAATRGDMFPAELCKKLSQLHSGARTHKLSLTEGELHSMLSHTNYRLVCIDAAPIGSGCIAQVHRAIIAPKNEKAGGGERQIAVKIVHPGVHTAAKTDIEVLRFVTGALEYVPRVRFLSLRESVEEFASLLHVQLDMRIEAANLERFSSNFENNKYVSFPKPIRPLVSSTLLCETLQEGEPLAEWMSGTCTANTAQKREVARLGVSAFLEMCFTHNFIHGDLHPGNILVVSPPGGNGPMSLSFLDAGITSELSTVDRQNFVSLFAAIVQGDGRGAGRLMVENSRTRECADPGAFCDGIARLVDSAVGHKLRLEKIQAGNILAQAFALACMHKVKIESNFANVCIAIMVLEGVGRELDPTLDILEAAAPVVLRNLVRNNFATAFHPAAP